MRTHPRHCKGSSPCDEDHTYLCARCGGEFITHSETHFKNVRQLTLPSKFWPVCSLPCYRASYATSSDSNPNGISWNDIGAIPLPDWDPDEPIDFMDLDDLDHLARIDLETILEENPGEALQDLPINDQAKAWIQGEEE